MATMHLPHAIYRCRRTRRKKETVVLMADLVVAGTTHNEVAPTVFMLMDPMAAADIINSTDAAKQISRPKQLNEG